MANDVTVLSVLLYRKPIGTLTRLSGDRTLFAFNDSYIADKNRPTLSLQFKDDLGNLITDFNPVRTRLMPFLSNLLPEGPMRAYLAERASVNPAREFFLLWVLGEDLPGAISIQPTDGEACLSMPMKDSERPVKTQERTRCVFPLRACNSNSRQSRMRARASRSPPGESAVHGS